MWDLEGQHGRSARRNAGIDEAAALGCDWLFFLDADDLFNVGAFAAFGKYYDRYDAVWGNICENIFGTDQLKLREGQLVATESVADILSTPPFLTLQMGLFVRTECAAAVKFDTEMDTGEDFKFYLGLWSKYRCAKVPEIFFINRRGYHSTGPRSAVRSRQGVESRRASRRSRLLQGAELFLRREFRRQGNALRHRQSLRHHSATSPAGAILRD
ncbi:hypothetical protein [Parvibaculum sedimenti]|uniref:hypothetical protein n=1 Tax=Parvibaculum sedimenti TaxID=2608632 RepID=UPI001FE3CA90|nr:hypothetical protein [Parvibaculum sedimenti]